MTNRSDRSRGSRAGLQEGLLIAARAHAARAVLAASVLCLAGPVAAEPSKSAASEYRAKMEQWVETRQILSEERAEWLVERESLEATRDLLRDERQALKEQIATLQSTDAGTSEERDQLVLKKDEYQRSADALAGQVLALEQQVQALVPKLPEPLQKKLEPVLVQIPKDPTTTKVSLGQRLMNVLAVVAQAEKWNGTATFVGETRDVGDGQKVAVRTLYWGLAQAIYVDSQGETAGIGRPTPSGWQFVDDPDLADRAREILDIYEGIVDTIAFVPVPAEIQ